MLCTGSFCRLRKVYKIYFVQTENDFPIDYHGIWQHIEHRYRDIGAFKIYVSDTGLLCTKKELRAEDILYMTVTDELNDFKGGMTENYVDTQLTANGYTTCYWERERGAEIDFVIRRGGDIIPIEVKSADNTRAKSLRVYMDTYHPAYTVKLSAKNFGMEDNKKLYRCTLHFACDNRTPWQNLYAGALAAWLPATFFLSFQKMVVK